MRGTSFNASRPSTIFRAYPSTIFRSCPSTIFRSYGARGAPRCGIFDRRGKQRRPSEMCFAPRFTNFTGQAKTLRFFISHRGRRERRVKSFFSFISFRMKLIKHNRPERLLQHKVPILRCFYKFLKRCNTDILYRISLLYRRDNPCTFNIQIL